MNQTPLTTQNYNYGVVRQFTIMTVVWGIVGMLVGVIIAAQLSLACIKLRCTLSNIQSVKAASYKCCNICFWWLCFVRYLILHSSENLSYDAVCSRASKIYFLGMAINYCSCCGNSTLRVHAR